MKIDIHTHTKRTKSGDPPTREISAAAFCETVLSTEVKVIAITNHNLFDLAQFREITSRFGADAQAWPGVELDVFSGESRGHLLVIVSPKFVVEFSAALEQLTTAHTPDTFCTRIDDILAAFDDLNPLYVATTNKRSPASPTSF